MTTPQSLAIVVIARNEERTIEACLNSCLAAARRAELEGLLRTWEIVLVDSASTDRTRGIAARLPVRIIEIPQEWPLSAAAGRYVGVSATDSDLVMFVDGDYVLNPSWLPVGLLSLQTTEAAAVCGVDREVLLGTSAISRYVLRLTDRLVPETETGSTDTVAVGLYRRDWIERAGGVQPYLRGAEDRDLAIRVNALGGRLVKTKAIMGFHHWAPGEDLNLIEYFRSVARWSFGEGQAMRHAFQEASIRRVYLRRYLNARHLIQLETALALVASGSIVLAAAIAAQIPFLIAATGTAAALVVLTARRHHETVAETLFRLHQAPYAVIRLFSFGLGTLKRTRPASEYPFQPSEV